MARGRKRGSARGRSSDGAFNPTRKSPTKKGSPRKKSTSPRKGRKPEQEEIVDEGIAATPDDTSHQAQLENDDSTYASSPPRQTARNTPLPTPVRKNAARSTRSNRVFVESISRSFEPESVGGAEVAAAIVAQSKAVVLKVAPQKLREIVGAYAIPKKIVTLGLSPEKLRQVQRKFVDGDLVPETVKQPEELVLGEAAEMAPVKDKSPHDVLDGKLSCNKTLPALWILTAIWPDHFKDVIQNFYDIASITHGYLPESHGPLVNKR
jgi:hypothetical protein